MSEIKRKLDVLKSEFDGRDFLAESIYPVEYTLPEEVDHRPKMGKPRDQGSDGACAGFAGSAMKELQEHKDVELDEYLSPQFIYNLRKNAPESGMYMRDLMKILREFGVCKEETYKYGRKQKPDKMPQKAYNEAAKYVIESYAAVNTVDACKRAIFQNGPVVLAVPVYNYGEHMWKPDYDGQSLKGGHAMAIVGYSDVEQHFIVRNSWGTSWEDGGFTYFPYTHWGMQWEIWTTIDASSKEEPVEPEPVEPVEPEPVEPTPEKKSFWQKIVDFFKRLFSKG